MDREIEYLRRTQEGPVNVAALKSLKQLRKLIDKKVDAPEPFKKVLEDWNKFRVYAITAVVYDEYPALTKCWKHLQAKFGEWAFDESMICAWAFFNFPLENGLSFGENFVASDDAPEQLKPFVRDMVATRLGLYQVVLNSGKYLRLKELITDKVFEAHNTIDTPATGEISLARLVPVDDRFMIFGSPSSFPAEYKEQLESMVLSKMLLYYGEGSDSYEKHMKLSGPYWVSVVSENRNADILNPDYQERYHDEELTFTTSLPDWMMPKSTEAEDKKLKARKDKRKAARKARKKNR
ncbi:hypothetical protein [Pseudobacteriovorax antillogorgiicola]|uniref:Uncharacterized protein n=1 Tax=Pseudobacteriovorax antillogorgiicola TaxID=1513793 RepID=A0A1Y6C3G0_9BACT|nr:hypothetical protein [Pseudobacteriovorax antillogorgiicola]TCS43362.1 hypothetical protein EDD56_1372 [Pseudobacteriovorax antillogorgiicola]SMF35151.1 hypothetical protein SAMN06296036_110206 [Pseudobacteriovorax antillogorgiicola]